MKRILVSYVIACAGCASMPRPIVEPTELLMTVAGHGTECLVTLGHEQFVTSRLESDALKERLRSLQGHTILLQILRDAPYRCVGSAIIMIQGAGMRFRAPQIPSTSAS